jgi:hypothetical protein
MALNKTSIIGLTEEWRPNKSSDSYRIAVFKNGKQDWISSKIDADLEVINSYLKANNLRASNAMVDDHFLKLRTALHLKYRNEHGLREYNTRARIMSDNALFDFDGALDLYTEHKADTTAIPMKHRWPRRPLQIPPSVAGSKSPSHPGKASGLSITRNSDLSQAWRLLL